MTISIRADQAFLPACWIVLVVGCAVVAGMLAAPAGVWMELWPYQTGFAIATFMHPIAAITAIALIVLGSVLFVLRRRAHAYYSVLFLWLHLLTALMCAIAWYIPVFYHADDGKPYPPIHDVSTDLVDIPQFVAVLPQRIDAPTTVYGDSPEMTPQLNAQLQQEAYADLTPHYYDASVSDMYYRAYSAAFDLGWALVAAVPEEGRIEATDTTFWFRLKEDVVIRIRTEDGRTRIDARSLSRVPGGDQGSNARRLRQFFKILADYQAR